MVDQEQREKNLTFVCDQTDSEIPEGRRCAAFTAWQPGQMDPLVGWELAYLNPDQEGEE